MVGKIRDTDWDIFLTIGIISFINFKVASFFAILFIIHYLGNLFKSRMDIEKANNKKELSKALIWKGEKIIKQLKIKKHILRNINIQFEGENYIFRYLLITKKAMFNIDIFNDSDLMKINYKYLRSEKIKQKNVLSNILYNKCKIYNVILLTNNNITITGKEMDEIKVLKISEFNDYVIEVNNNENMVGSNLEEIVSNIIQYKNNTFSIYIYNLMKENMIIGSFTFSLILFLICLWQFNTVPSTIIENVNKEVHATFENKETYPVNETIVFSDINIVVSITSVSKTDYGTIIELNIENKSNNNIKSNLFSFSIIDNSRGINYNMPFKNHDVIIKGEKKPYIFKCEDISSDCYDITLNVIYDDFIEYRLDDTINITLR